MKNFFKSLAICALAALTFASCQKENADGNMDDQSSVVSINLTSPLMGTKAFADGNTVNVVHVHVYKVGANGELTYIDRGTDGTVTPSQDVRMSNGSATYSTRLVTGQTYTFVFWADYIDNNGNSHYTYDPDTKTIAVNYDNAACNDETRDAFYAVLPEVKITGAYSQSVSLKRPFAQVNFGVTTEDYNAAVAAGVTVNGAAVKFTKAANAINLLNGTTSGDVIATFRTAPSPSETLNAAGTTYKYVAMNYVLVGKDTKTLSDITLTLDATGAASGKPEYTYTSIPLQGNYRTNIVGDLFTSPANINITVDSNFAGDETHVQNVSSVNAANQAFANGATNVTISVAESGDPETIVLPNTLKSVTLTIKNYPTDRDLTIDYSNAEGAQKPASLSITAPNAQDITINCPESHVEINGVTANSITASTSNNTLVIGEDAHVTNLIIEAGAVEIYGTVDNLTNNGTGDIKVWAVADAATWSKAYAAGAKKIELKADINAEVTTTLSVPKDGVVDGKGKTVSGDISLYVNAVGGTIQNMNFKEIHNAVNKLSPVYASGLTGKLVITGCTFDTFDWDAIQTTPQAGAEIEITGNTFKYTSEPGGNNRRYVHIESPVNTDFSAKITGNSFLNNSQLTMCALEVYYFIDNNKIDLNGNYFDSPAKVCILSGYGSVATDVLKNMKVKKTPQGEEVNLAAYIKINNYDLRICTSLNEVSSALSSGQTIYLLNDVNISEPLTITVSSSSLRLNGNTINNIGTTSAIMVETGGKLSISGNGKVYGGQGGNNTAITVKGTLVVNSGEFSVGPDADNAGNSCIYSVGGTVTINGGTFSTEKDWRGWYYVLNQQNGNPGTITVKGGTFVNYNPANGDDNLGGNFIAEGYESVETTTEDGKPAWKVSKKIVSAE